MGLTFSSPSPPPCLLRALLSQRSSSAGAARCVRNEPTILRISLLFSRTRNYSLKRFLSDHSGGGVAKPVLLSAVGQAHRQHPPRSGVHPGRCPIAIPHAPCAPTRLSLRLMPWRLVNADAIIQEEEIARLGRANRRPVTRKCIHRPSRKACRRGCSGAQDIAAIV